MSLRASAVSMETIQTISVYRSKSMPSPSPTSTRVSTGTWTIKATSNCQKIDHKVFILTYF